MRTFTIGSNEAGQRFDKYLHKLLPEAGNSFLYKMLRKKNITLNNGTMTITLTDNTQFQFENIGSASSSGAAPQIRINTQTNEWEISSDSGNSWVSTGVKATGEKGSDGADGAKGEDGISPKV